MTTGWGEALSGAGHSGMSGAYVPARTEAADDAGSASDAVAVPALSGEACVYGRLPEWPETSVYVYI